MKSFILESYKNSVVRKGEKILKNLKLKFYELTSIFLSEETKIQSFIDLRDRLHELNEIEKLFDRIKVFEDEKVKSNLNLCYSKFTEISQNYCKHSGLRLIRSQYQDIKSFL